MQNSLPIVGSWWLPNNYRKRISGKLFIDDINGLCLELNGHLLDSNILRQSFGVPLDFINGKSINHNEITLKDSVLISFSRNSSKYKVYACFSGITFNKLNDIRFNVVNVSFRHLNKWVMNHFFDDDMNTILSTKKASLGLRLEPIDLGRISNFNLRIKINKLSQVYKNEITGFQYSSALEISTEKPRLFDEFLEISIKFSSFLSFATLQPALISEMDGVIHHKRKKYNCVDILLRFREFEDSEDSSANYYGLIPFQFIEEKISQVINKYFELVKTYDSVYDLYLSSIINPSTVIDNEFRNLVEGLEAYHRRRLPGKYVSNDDFRREVLPRLIEAIPCELDRSFKEKLSNSMEYMNEYSLRKRITELIRNLPKDLNLKIQKESGYREDIIRNIVLIRNHFAHFDPEEKRYIPKDAISLQLLNEEMRLILEANILADLGIDVEYINKLIRIPKRFHH
ncbi:MAG: hypothetical protein HPY72_00010 [Anaerolineae bacterium]|nr:hypothetical protein [Anaerolineae bacterium]